MRTTFSKLSAGYFLGFRLDESTGTRSPSRDLVRLAEDCARFPAKSIVCLVCPLAAQTASLGHCSVERSQLPITAAVAFAR